MADNVHRISHKQLDGSRKITNPVHRTTTETIRLTDLDRTHQSLGLSTTTNTTPNNQCRKKPSSFQITSVADRKSNSNDVGDDSNDEDKDDNSIDHSRGNDLDVETPSYSEDTISKEDVFFNASNSALSEAPVIPTSSQYGLAIVPPEGGNISSSMTNSNINTLDITSVTDNNIINLLSNHTKQDTDLRDVHTHGRNERFKVVKIESTEPFKRGRWMCMDYLDHPSVNQSSAINTPKVSDPNEVCISYGVTDGGIVALETQKPSNIVESKTMSVDMNGHHIGHHDVHATIGSANNPGGNFTVNNTMTQNVQQQLQAQGPGQQIPQYFQPTSQQQQQQQLASQQGATLPTNLQPTHPNNLGQPQSMPQGAIPIITQTNNNNVSPQQNISHTKDDSSYVTVGTPNQTLSGQNTATSSQTPNILVTQHQNQQQQHQQAGNQITEPMTSMQGMQGTQNIHKVPQAGGQQSVTTLHGAAVQSQVMTPGQMQPQTSGSNAQVQMNQQNVVGGGGMQQGSMGFRQGETEQDSVAGFVPATTVAQSADATLLESLAEVTQSNDDHHALEDNERYVGIGGNSILFPLVGNETKILEI